LPHPERSTTWPPYASLGARWWPKLLARVRCAFFAPGTSQRRSSDARGNSAPGGFCPGAIVADPTHRRKRCDLGAAVGQIAAQHLLSSSPTGASHGVDCGRLAN
jgi:hypothetical protein